MPEQTTIVDHGDTIAVTMRLDNLGELFTAPELDPFTEQSRTTAGVDDLTAHLSARRLRNKPTVQLTIILPPAQVTPGLDAEVRAALGRYCDHEAEQTRRSTAASRFEGFNKLPVGIIVAGATVLISLGLYMLLPDFLQNIAFILTPVITVIVWVSIWNPIEVLLYEGWADRRSLQILKVIRSMAVTVTPA